MSDFEKYKENLAYKQTKQGKGTGLTSKMLSGVNIFLWVYLVIVLFKDQFYIPALFFLALAFTRFSHWASIGLAVYFGLIGYWKGFVLLLVVGLIGWGSVWFGMKNVKKNLFSDKAEISPFEGMQDLVLYFIIQVVLLILALVTSGILSLILWLLFGLITLVEISRYYFRLRHPWCKVHYSLMQRYSMIAGRHAGLAERKGDGDFDIREALADFVKIIYPTWDKSKVDSFLDGVLGKLNNFSDREDLLKFFKKINPNVKQDTLKKLGDKIRKELKNPKDKSGKVAWVIAEVIGKDYGKNERIRYLHAVITSEAK